MILPIISNLLPRVCHSIVAVFFLARRVNPFIMLMVFSEDDGDKARMPAVYIYIYQRYGGRRNGSVTNIKLHRAPRFLINFSLPPMELIRPSLSKDCLHIRRSLILPRELLNRRSFIRFIFFFFFFFFSSLCNNENTKLFAHLSSILGAV